MKIRHGFVSNSSTCAFLLIGWMVDDEQALEFARRQCDDGDDPLPKREDFPEDYIGESDFGDALQNYMNDVDGLNYIEEKGWAVGYFSTISSDGDAEIDPVIALDAANEYGALLKLEDPMIIVGGWRVE